jgi:hypothetical protein
MEMCRVCVCIFFGLVEGCLLTNGETWSVLQLTDESVAK